MKIVVFCSGARHLEKKFKTIAKNIKVGESIVEFFPDNELRQRFSKNLDLKGKDVWFIQSFYKDNRLSINDRIFETLTAFYNAKSLQARKIYLIATYFPYLREDKRFEKNEAITARAMAWLFSCFNKVFIFEPHLHRLKSFAYWFPKASRVSLTEFFVNEIKKLKLKQALIIAPDEEAEQWVKPITKKLGFSFVVLKKKRINPEKVIIKLNKEMGEKNIIIIDDIASTGKTLLEVVKKIKGKNIYCFVFHGLFVNEKVLSGLKKYARIFTTNTTFSKAIKERKINVIDITKKIYDIIKNEK